jgi:tRNA A37 methylthiotransferase MiaB
MASHRLTDDVPYDVKLRRHVELVDAFRDCAQELNKSLIGKYQVVLIEGVRHRIHRLKLLTLLCWTMS